ncbi:MAG: hypothetical protein ACRC92_00675 [Peptostreptococcaceae bacterium]
MIKYLIKKKMQKEAEEHGKKVLIYTGAVLTGVGVYVSYKAIKNHRRKRQMDDTHYLVDSEYDMYNYDDEVEESEKSELQQKVDEFNSRRINCENCPDVSTEEMVNYVESIKDSKDDVEINEEDYKEEAYDKYEYYEDDLEEK